MGFKTSLPDITFVDEFRTEGAMRTGWRGPILDALNELDERTEAAPQDRDAILFDAVAGLVSGSLKGVEGRWDVAYMFDSTVESGGTFAFGFGTATWFRRNGTLTEAAPAVATSIPVNSFGITFGNSGTPYLVVSVYNGDTYCYAALHPKHGDVTSDFTTGNTYTVIVCQENSTPAQDENGDLTITEYLLGGDVDTVAEIEAVIGGSAPQVGTINAGYRSGKTWTSQLLDDLPVFLVGGRTFQACRKILNGKSLTLEYRNATGAWVAGTLTPVGWGETALAWTIWNFVDAPAENRIGFNVAQSWSVLGYSSEADMLNRSAVKIVYKTKARRVRPANNPTGVKVLGGFAWYLNHATDVGGAPLVSELTGTVPVNSVVPAFGQAAVKSLGFYAGSGSLPGAYTHAHETVALNSAGPNAVKFLAGLFQSGGNWHVALWFSELIYDTDWGDSGQIPMESNVVTDTDDNGNVVVVGCMSFDTGVKHV